jgi:hypothetical protein
MKVEHKLTRIGSYLAMLALVTGILASFGHVHCQMSHDDGGAAFKSVGDHTSDGDEGSHSDRCDVCALIVQFSATILASVVAAFAIVFMAHRAHLAFCVTLTPRASVFPYFQSRAPPQI